MHVSSSLQIEQFVENPKGFVLKLETIQGRKVVKAEAKGVLTWIKAHLLTKLFGDWIGNYKLEDIHAHIKGLSIPDHCSEGINKVIKSWNAKNAGRRPELEEFDTRAKTEARRADPDYKLFENQWAEKCYQADPSRHNYAFGGDFGSLVDELYFRKISPDRCPFDAIFTVSMWGGRFLLFSADGYLGCAVPDIKKAQKPLFIFQIDPERLGSKASGKDLTSDAIRDYILAAFPSGEGFTSKEEFHEVMKKSTFVWQDINSSIPNESLIHLLKN